MVVPTGRYDRALRHGIGGLLLLAAVALAQPARADDDAPKPAPRTSVIIGDASVVLVAANDQLYAFIDRVSDNAPVADAELHVETAEGIEIPMGKARMSATGATEGLLVGALKRPGRMQDAFMISLKSSAGSGDAPAEITYSDVTADRATTPATGVIGNRIAIAVALAGIGAVGTVLVRSFLFNARKKRLAQETAPT